MSEIDKEIDKSIKRKKLKTTTLLITLLVSVALISSSAVTAITLNVNENTTTIETGDGQTAPGFSGEEVVIGGEEFGDHIFQAEKPFQYAGSTRQIVVWDNGMSYDDGWTAQTTLCTYDGEPADDFILDATTDIMDVHWTCIYIYDFVDCDWYIRFYDDDGSGNWPNTQLVTEYMNPTDTYLGDFYGYPVYEHSVDIPSFTATGGTKYWLSLQADTPCYPRTFWGMLLFSGPLNTARFKSNYFTGGVWTASYYYHMNFQLTTKPDHDVYGIDVIAPTDNSEFCPCTPVVATFGNGGQHDETDVPISVEIRRYIPTPGDSFELPFGSFWDPIYAGNMWMQSSWEMVYPFATGPRGGAWMAELDSGMTGPGQAYLDSLPIDLSGLCHPMMEFYMWHDEYGSDDFIDVEVNGVPVGGPYTRLCCPGCPTGWKRHVIDLNDFNGQTVVIRFEGNCDSVTSAYELMIDDFAIYDQEYYEEALIDIDVGEVVEHEFPEWCPCHWQDPAWANTCFDVEIVACTAMDGDEHTANDCVSEDATLCYPFEHDIMAKSIDEPVGKNVPVQTFEMCGTIKNVGQYTECCFSVYMFVQEFEIGPEQTILFEDFSSCTVPPAGWTTSVLPGYWYTWHLNYYYNNAGSGCCAELNSDWFYSGCGGELVSPVLNLGSAVEAELNFGCYYTGSWVYEELRVDVWDGSAWNNEWTTSSYYDGTMTIDLTGYIGISTVQVRFIYEDFGNWGFYPQIDDVEVTMREGTFYDYEYEDDFCVDEIEVCEEMQICFKDWTPAEPWPDCGSKTYAIILETRLCDPEDDNHANDIWVEYITVDFWHDVAVNGFTEPADDGSRDCEYELIYDDDYWCWGFGSTTGHIYMANRWTPTELAGLDGMAITSVMWKNHDSVNHDGTITVYGEGTSSAPGAVLTTQTFTGLGYGWHDIALDNPVTIDETEDLWLCCDVFHASGQYPMECSCPGIVGKTCFFSTDGASWLDLVAYGYNCAVCLRGCVNEDTGPPTPEIYIPCGNQEICVEVENLGTFDEPNCEVHYEIYEYISNYPDPTLDDSGFVLVDLDVGQVENVCLTTHNFDETGVYEVIVWIEPEGGIVDGVTDCYVDNNYDSKAIGVDCCPPESEHTLDPAEPNGEGNWYTVDVEVCIEAVDPPCPDPCEQGIISGVDVIKYEVNGVPGEISGSSGCFTLDQDGNNLVKYYAIDNAGNEETEHIFTVAIDTTDPSCDLQYETYQDESGNYMVDFEAVAADVTSGMNRVEFKKDGVLLDTINAPPYTLSYAWQEGDGSKTFYAYAYDNAGNSASDSATIKMNKQTSQSLSQSAELLNLYKVLQQGI
jgi:hypothetical protein